MLGLEVRCRARVESSREDWSGILIRVGLRGIYFYSCILLKVGGIAIWGVGGEGFTCISFISGAYMYVLICDPLVYEYGGGSEVVLG